MKYKSDFKKYCKYEDEIFKNILFVCLFVYLKASLIVPFLSNTRSEDQHQTTQCAVLLRSPVVTGGDYCSVSSAGSGRSGYKPGVSSR